MSVPVSIRRSVTIAVVVLSATSLSAPAWSGAARWRTDGTAGAEISVPAAWKINDFGCGMSQGPTIVRAPGIQTLCLTPETARKEVAVLGDGEAKLNGSGLAGTPKRVTVSGKTGLRLERRLRDGRYAGYVKVPSARLVLTVRTHERSKTTRILNSLRFVKTDVSGCATDRSRAPQRPGGVKGSRLVPSDPASISVCYYEQSRLVQASYRVTGKKAKAMAAALNKARPGFNKDAPECGTFAPTYPDVVLRFKDRSGHRSRVVVTFSGCRNRGIDNGHRKGALTGKMLSQVMSPLHVGFGWSGPL